MNDLAPPLHRIRSIRSHVSSLQGSFGSGLLQIDVEPLSPYIERYCSPSGLLRFREVHRNLSPSWIIAERSGVSNRL